MISQRLGSTTRPPSPELASRFEAEIDAALDRILEHPLMYQEVHREVRRAPVHDFPYLVFDGIEGDAVIVYRVLHGARSPRRWPR